MSSIPRSTLYIRNGVTAGVCDPKRAQGIVSKGHDIEARHARYITRDPTLSDEHSYVECSIAAGTRVVAELREERSGRGHTLIAMHLID